ncbi:DUF2752 domain-containing protein [Pedobacter sp. Leaf250]|uniref:DUF2752 domain-containing protein n=1 Tax=Pedobacter sp. Leaf250 TaxID=2876559 RepID=UPI001217C88C|nr:DUF2752 domain-containing protein [Pedobacter sp. Leaf250]RZL12270.1 MAG: DUF2752 domain-containing protein [Pedobacter sp.]
MILQQPSFFDWLGRNLLACPFKTYFGFDCPGCGLQRSIISLMKGDLIVSFKYYPATIPLILLIIFTGLHLKFDFKFGASAIKFAFLGIAVIVLISYIYKIYNHQLTA